MLLAFHYCALAMEALIRLATAHAKLKLRKEEVLEEDVIEAENYSSFSTHGALGWRLDSSIRQFCLVSCW